MYRYNIIKLNEYYVQKENLTYRTKKLIFLFLDYHVFLEDNFVLNIFLAKILICI